MKTPAVILALCIALSGCGDIDGGGGARGDFVSAPSGKGTTARSAVPVQPGIGRSVAPPAAQADAFARQFLDSIQAQSFAQQREFCGYFIHRLDGQIVATPPRPGTFASCQMPAPQPGQRIFASYHTHGAFGREYDNEVPSATDLQSDFDFGIDGYVSTPGGRVWRVEYDTRDTFQICGLGCVAVDPNFAPQGEAGILQRFTLGQLVRRNG